MADKINSKNLDHRAPRNTRNPGIIKPVHVRPNSAPKVKVIKATPSASTSTPAPQTPVATKP